MSNKNLGSPLSMEGVGNEDCDSRHRKAYRVIEIGDPEYKLRLEVPEDSPFYEYEIKRVKIEIETKTPESTSDPLPTE